VRHTLAAEPDAFPGELTRVRCDGRTGLEGVIWIEDQLLAGWGAALPAEAQPVQLPPKKGLTCGSGPCASGCGAAEISAPESRLVCAAQRDPASLPERAARQKGAEHAESHFPNMIPVR
jgi:hypothetical protein